MFHSFALGFLPWDPLLWIARGYDPSHPGGRRSRMIQINHRTVDANGIRIYLAEQGTGPLVLPCHHGFPESWYSWQH
jgi:hypothetical protein